MLKNSKLICILLLVSASTSESYGSEQGEAVPVEKNPVSENILTSKSAQTMEQARQALIGGNIDRAIALYTRLSESGDGDDKPYALEFLGVARERKGQRAHAKAVYERYLVQYPDTAGYQRVQQRLNALLAPPNAKKVSETRTSKDSSQPRWTINGSYSSYYRSNTVEVDEQESINNLSMWQGNIDLIAQRTGKDIMISSRLSAAYRQDFTDEGSERDPLVISKAYVDLESIKRRVSLRMGRQSRSAGGVYGRFDGLRTRWDFRENMSISAVAGHPVRRSSMQFLNSDRLMYGLSLDFNSKNEAWKYGLFANNHVVDGIADRRGIGGEFRYFDQRKNLYGVLDFDALYSSVNALLLGGTITTQNRHSYYLTVDYRRNPLLSTSNAIIGQGTASLNELSIGLTEDELRALAEDNTATSMSATFGASIPLSERLQWSSYIQLSNLETAVNFQSLSQSDPNNMTISLNSQLMINSLWRESDAWTLAARFADSDSYQSGALNIGVRFPITKHFRLHPIVRTMYRKHVISGNGEWILTPVLRASWRWGGGSVLELDTHYEHARQDMDSIEVNRNSLYFSLGYRAGFGR